MVSPLRSFVKAITYRVGGSGVTGIVVYVVTGQLDLAVGSGFLDAAGKIALYYLHERLWDRVKWGRAIPRWDDPQPQWAPLQVHDRLRGVGDSPAEAQDTLSPAGNGFGELRAAEL